MTGSGYFHPSAGDKALINDNGECNVKIASEMDTISLVLASETICDFSPLLQMGFNIPAMVPCTLGNFLQEQLGLDREYVSERITTIFVDGKTTDSLDETVINDHSTIALSAAMPGVVGATFRRGSYYAAMRSAITSMENINTGTCEKGQVCVKLFNLLLTDLGPMFLEKGIFMSASDLSGLFSAIPGNSLQACREVTINGQCVDPSCLQHIDQSLIHENVKLSIRFT
jgi:hypothetical protein